MREFKYDFGTHVRNRVSGYEGVVTAQVRWMNGCLRYSVESKQLHDGKPIDCSFDEEQLEAVPEKPPVAFENRNTGGPMPEITRR